MTKQQPVAEPILNSQHWATDAPSLVGATVTPWPEARERLAQGRTYWLATTRPGGRPHVMPLLAVWVDGALHFVASEGSRKARNLARSSRCVITVGTEGLDLVVEGDAAKVTDEAALSHVAEMYASKYEWHVTVQGGAFHGDGAPTAGPPPYVVYEVTPTTVFGFSTDETLHPTRWLFQR